MVQVHSGPPPKRSYRTKEGRLTGQSSFVRLRTRRLERAPQYDCRVDGGDSSCAGSRVSHTQLRRPGFLHRRHVFEQHVCRKSCNYVGIRWRRLGAQIPYYTRLKGGSDEDRRTAAGLLQLKEALASGIPPRTVGEDLLLATWNIREFESSKCGPRSMEPLHYIAEINEYHERVA